MKKILLRGLMLLLVAIMCCQLVACGGNDDPKGDTTTTATPGGDNPGNNPGNDPGGNVTQPPVIEIFEATLAKDGASTYTLVYPAGTAEGDPVYDALSALVKAFNQKLSVKLTLATDDAAPVENEILLGNTNRPETAEVLKGMKNGEAAYKLIGTKMVLVGTNEEATLTIATEFVDKVVNKADNKTLVFSSLNNYYKTKLYTLTSVLIDGAPIEDFVIVVPELNSVEHYVARVLARYIGIHNGTLLNVVDDSTQAAAHEIRIGTTNRTTTTAEASQFAVVPTGGNLEVVFGGLYGASEVATKLTEDYFNRTYWKADIKLINNNETIYIANKDDAGRAEDVTFPVYRDVTMAAGVNKDAEKDLRVMFYDVYGHANLENPNPVACRTPLYIATMATYMPDVVGIQEAGETWPTDAAALLTWFEANGYAKICFSNQGGLANPIFYNSSRLEVMQSGYEHRPTGATKGITWAVFRDKDTQKIFGVTSCHFSGANESNDDDELAVQNRQEEAQLLLNAKSKIHAVQNNCPIISGGNYNATYEEEIIKYDESGNVVATYAPLPTIIEGGYTDIRELVAEENVSDISPYNGASEFMYLEDYDIMSLRLPNNRKTEDAIDHVFIAGATTGCTFKQYRIVNPTITCTASDHLPHFVDFAWN